MESPIHVPVCSAESASSSRHTPISTPIFDFCKVCGCIIRYASYMYPGNLPDDDARWHDME